MGKVMVEFQENMVEIEGEVYIARKRVVTEIRRLREENARMKIVVDVVLSWFPRMRMTAFKDSLRVALSKAGFEDFGMPPLEEKSSEA